MGARIGVDIGGTFTDLVIYDDATGRIGIAKCLSTPAQPEVGVVDAIRLARPHARLNDVSHFMHGTTVALNALLTRTGAKVGLLTTSGFRDLLEIARGDRGDPYSLFWRQAPPLVPRRLRLPVRERIWSDGSVETPLDEADVERALAVFVDERVEAIAVAFLNAYANPVHELLAADVLRRSGFAGDVSLSHQISGEYHEYERTSTTVIDAYIRPSVTRYLTALGRSLDEHDFRGVATVARSGGGVFTFGEAQDRPFESIMSGPVSGAEGAAALARRLNLDAVITADVGGTSFDTCLILDGRPAVKYESEIAGMAVQSSWIDVRSIGAGGGSIAWVDHSLMKVGPASAGAFPGPACYGNGGTQATVTDAALLLGMLGDGVLANGVVLQPEPAAQAVGRIAEALGRPPEEMAVGIIRIAAAAMAAAIRSITVEQGQDPREAVLLAFGGAGPVFATLLATELDIDRIVIPPFPGNFSAWGALCSDLLQSASSTRIMPLTAESLERTAADFERLFAILDGRTDGREATSRELSIDMRFRGQEHSLNVAVEQESVRGRDDQTVAELFRVAYERTFAHVLELPIEIVSLRATARTVLPQPRLKHPAVSGPQADSGQTVDAWSFASGRRQPFRLLDMGQLGSKAISGPAIITAETSTIYVDTGFEASSGGMATLAISRAGAA